MERGGAHAHTYNRSLSWKPQMGVLTHGHMLTPRGTEPMPMLEPRPRQLKEKWLAG